jgi:hypothetical protein
VGKEYEACDERRSQAKQVAARHVQVLGQQDEQATADARDGSPAQHGVDDSVLFDADDATRDGR